MRRFWSLTRVLLAEVVSSASFRFGKGNQKWKPVLIWSLLGISCLPLFGLLLAMYQGLYMVFAPAGQLAYVTSVFLNIGCMVIFIFSAFSAPAIFYFSKEVEYLLPLPLRPAQIIGAKFTVSLIFEYIVALFVLLPMYIIYVIHMPAGWLSVHMLLTFVTLPVMPLIYSTVLVMLLMRLSRFGRDRDRINLFVGVIAIMFGLGISLVSQRMNQISPEQVEALMEGNKTALMTLQSIFPNNIFAGRAIAGAGGAYQLLNLLIVAAAFALFMLLAQALYFKGVIGISESSASRKKMSRDEIQKAAQTQSAFRACLQKELRLLFRSPTAFTNCVLMVFLMPLFIVLPFATNMNGGEDIQTLISVNYQDPRVIAIIWVGAAAAGFLMSAMNLVTTTAISREGSAYIFMKYIPVPYRTQLNAKAASGIAVGLMGMVVMFAVMELIFKAPWWVVLGAFVLMLPSNFFLNYVGLFIDLMKPKLEWDTEQRAVKQNMNVLIMMLLGFLLAGVLAVAGILFLKTPVTAFTVMLALTAVIAAAAYHFVLEKGSELLAKL